MKLSEAIREGAKLRPQNFGEFYKEGRTCVIGAAAEALTGLPPAMIDARQGFVSALVDNFPKLMETRVLCPTDCGAGRIKVWHALYHLNDQHKWTREQIADWVEKIETQ